MYLSIKMKIQSDLIGDNKFNTMNTITFKVDRTFSREYGQEKAYCLCLDLTADATSNEPPIALFTLKGADFITSKYPKKRWGVAA